MVTHHLELGYPVTNPEVSAYYPGHDYPTLPRCGRDALNACQEKPKRSLKRGKLPLFLGRRVRPGRAVRTGVGSDVCHELIAGWKLVLDSLGFDVGEFLWGVDEKWESPRPMTCGLPGF